MAAKQLKDTLDELEGTIGGPNQKQYLDKIGDALKEKDKEMNKMRATERARVSCRHW